MENYNQSSQKDENQQSSTTPNQYRSQDQNEPNRQGSQMQNERQDRTVDNDTRYGTDQRMSDQSGGNTDRNFEERSQRPNQYSAGGDEMDDVEEEEEDMDETSIGLDDMDEDMEDDAEQDSSATRQNPGSQRGSAFDNSQSTDL